MDTRNVVRKVMEGYGTDEMTFVLQLVEASGAAASAEGYHMFKASTLPEFRQGVYDAAIKLGPKQGEDYLQLTVLLPGGLSWGVVDLVEPAAMRERVTEWFAKAKELREQGG